MAGIFDAFDIFSSAPGETAAARTRRAQTKAAKQGFEEEAKYLGQGTEQQVGSLTKALAPFEDIYGQEQQGRQAYMGALGLGTPEEIAAARARFMASPGYQYQLEQGSQNVLRNQAAGGGLRSGQTAMDLNAYGQNLANQGWSDWLNRLGGFNAMNPARGMADVLTNIGQTYGQQGVNLASAARNKYDTLGNAGAQYAQNVYGAQQGANQNLWNAISGGLGLGSKLLGLGTNTVGGQWLT